MPQGNTKGGKYSFTDSSYDGFNKNHFLSAGLGMLTDGKLAPEDYVDSDGLGWVGWNAKDTPTPYIIFEFLKTRTFHSMTLHCNVRDKEKIKLFSKVEISFSVDGVSFNASLAFEPKCVSSRSTWMNYNVTIDLNRHSGKLMKLNFSYTGHWILISEVTFHPGISDGKERCSCYTFENDSPTSWLQAMNYCKCSNKHLVVMETEREWEFINKEIQTRKSGKENEWHIGLDRNLDTGKWAWINGKTVIIDKWQKDKPRDSDFFTVMAEGSFNSIKNNVNRGWICEEETDNCQGDCLVHNPVPTDSTPPGTTTPTTQRLWNISTVYHPTTASGRTFKEIAIVSAVGLVLFIVVARLAVTFFKKRRAGRMPNIPDGADEEDVAPYATVRFSRIFPQNAENNGPGDIPLRTLPFQQRTPPEERATGRTELRNSPYENTDHLGRSSVNTLEYLIYQPRYENETIDNETRDVVIRPGYDKLVSATRKERRENGGADLSQRLPCGMVDTHGLSVYDSLIRETDLRCKSRRGDIIDSEIEDNMNIHTILEVHSSDERSPACSMDKKKNKENSLGDIEFGCTGNDSTTSDVQDEVKPGTSNLSPRSQAAFKMEDQPGLFEFYSSDRTEDADHEQTADEENARDEGTSEY